MPHTIVNARTGERILNVDYCGARSLQLAKDAASLFRTIYGPEHSFAVAIVADDGYLVELPILPYPPLPPVQRSKGPRGGWFQRARNSVVRFFRFFRF